MNISSINDKNNKLNMYITEAMEGLDHCITNLLFEYNPRNYFEVKKFRDSITKLRAYAKESILQHIKDMESDDFVTNDILSIIFKTASMRIDIFKEIFSITYWFLNFKRRIS